VKSNALDMPMEAQGDPDGEIGEELLRW